VLSGHIFV